MKDEHSPKVSSVLHPLIVILSAACDLKQDFMARFPCEEAQRDYFYNGDIKKQNSLILYALAYDLYRENEVSPPSGLGSAQWRSAKKNQNQRYHCLPAASINDLHTDDLPALYLDFKKVLAIPTGSLYEGLRMATIERLALIPEFYIHELMHRCFGFLSRVGVPD